MGENDKEQSPAGEKGIAKPKRPASRDAGSIKAGDAPEEEKDSSLESTKTYTHQCGQCGQWCVGSKGISQHQETSKRCMAYSFYHKGYSWPDAQQRAHRLWKSKFLPNPRGLQRPKSPEIPPKRSRSPAKASGSKTKETRSRGRSAVPSRKTSSSSSRKKDKKQRSPQKWRSSRSPLRKKSRSPQRKKSKSPQRKKSRSPQRKKSKSPQRKKSRSPESKSSKSPQRKKSRSPEHKKSKSPQHKKDRREKKHKKASGSPSRKKPMVEPEKKKEKKGAGHIEVKKEMEEKASDNPKNSSSYEYESYSEESDDQDTRQGVPPKVVGTSAKSGAKPQQSTASFGPRASGPRASGPRASGPVTSGSAAPGPVAPAGPTAQEAAGKVEAIADFYQSQANLLRSFK